MLGKIWDSVRSNHIAMMAVCCMLPVLIIVGLGFAGFSGGWIYAIAIVACIGSHLAMMATSKDGKACH